ncbi:MAG: transglutaminase family protein, partial [Pseudomonadota bacterium]|nr:transglutaminase family protein [Pseudomonadota bacterium]
MLYDISLKITYSYADMADAGRHLVRVMPADLPGQQRAVSGTLTVTPRPTEWIDRTDFFGNRFTELLFDQPHEEMSLALQARVERLPARPELDISPSLAGLAREIAARPGVGPDSPHHFTGPSIRVPVDRQTTDYAKRQLQPDSTVLEAVKAINTAIHDDMLFDPEATTVETPMLEAFERRHGVCQDFSHVMIACLRGIGVPAGYVSGYLRTLPPPGRERLEGADAMHAWVRAWCGTEMGWLEFDPTNDTMAGEDHVVIARA